MNQQASGVDNGKQVVARAAAVLQALEGKNAGISLGEIARLTGLPKSTVQRLVAALEGQQMVAVGHSGVRLGPAITRLAGSIHTDVVSVAAPLVEAASRRVRETVDLSVNRGLHALSVFQHSSDQELRVLSPVGAAFPMYCTAHGKAMLATLPDAQVTTLLARGLEQRTPNTIVKIAALLEELEQIRTSGFAFDIEEHAEGVCGIAVVLDCEGPDQYALSIGVPSLRFEKSRPALRSALLKCKAEIEQQFRRSLPPRA